MATHRVTARVLPVSPDGAVLLLREQDPARRGEIYWASVGGAVDPGESLRETAVRELLEETGIVVPPDDLVGPVHQLVDPFSWGGVAYVGDSTYFAVRVPRDARVTFDRLEPEEIGNLLGADWWRPEDLPDEVAVRPSGLRDIMRAAVAAIPPSRHGGEQ
ncbi:NUDIX hydrolase [Nocardioides sp.]|uniref:NUDIX hydrolase n=1 Tax=Nocardioides sp. TaxID=35761 RepID=UPI002727E062|nr:NUDIX domain-containing protein [Nocardioides sp.]MDO9454830.1 NUDIX domain-containing protein [Nocardioides sp.]